MRKLNAIASRRWETAFSAALTAFARLSIAMRKLMLVSGAESELDGWARAMSARPAEKELEAKRAAFRNKFATLHSRCAYMHA